jgi:hypothetical protein
MASYALAWAEADKLRQEMEQEEERKRKERAALEALAKVKMQMDEQPEAKRKVDLALGNIPKDPSRLPDVDFIADIPMSVKSQINPLVGNAPIPRSEVSMSDVPNLKAIGETNWSDKAEKAGLFDLHRGQPEVQSFIQTQAAKEPGIVEPDKQKGFEYLAKSSPKDASDLVKSLTDPSAANSGVFGYKERYDTPENRKLNEDAIDNLLSEGKISEVDAKIFRNSNQGAGVWETMNRLGSIAKGVTEQVRGQKEQIPGKIEELEATLPAKTRTAYATAQAAKSGQTAGLDRLSETHVVGLTGLQEAASTLDEAINQFNDKYVGVFSGRYGNIKEAIGTVPEGEAVFRSFAQRFQNALIKANAGAAVSEQEMQRMVKETFDYNLNPKTYLAKVKANLAFVKYRNDLLISNLEGANYDVSRQYRYSSGRGRPGVTVPKSSEEMVRDYGEEYDF